MPDADNDAYRLFDENDAVGNPPSKIPQTSWRLPANGSGWVNPTLIVDLQCEHIISEVYFFDGPKNGENVRGGGFKLYAGRPFNWGEPLIDYKIQNISEWKHVKLQNEVRVRYLQIEKYHTETFLWSDMSFFCDANIGEMVFYGTPIGKPVAKPLPKPAPKFGFTMGEFIGINSFLWTKEEDLDCIGFIREYHNWTFTDPNNTSYPNNKNVYESHGVMLDDYYARLKEKNIGICICVQTASQASDSVKPAWAGPTTEPASYEAHADHMYQLAARYGKTPVDEKLLRADEKYGNKTALDLINYYENWNEPDNWWVTGGEWFSPYELAAMTSADYDGHALTMGNKVGIKNADPHAKFVMGGLSNMSFGYIKAMLLWFEEFRPDDNTIFDVLNFHDYCFSGSQGCSPEKAKLKEKMQEKVNFRNTYFPNAEIWLSEFGWDRDPGSPLCAVAHAGFDANEVQAQWIVREYLILAAAGIDRAQVYMIDDAVNEDSPMRHMTSGLIAFRGDERLPSWYYTATLKNRLDTMVFEGEVVSGSPDVWVYSFKEKDKNAGAYALWCPTEDGTQVNGYTLALPKGVKKASVVTLEDKNINGVETALKINDGAVTVDISERPIFVMME